MTAVALSWTAHGGHRFSAMAAISLVMVTRTAGPPSATAALAYEPASAYDKVLADALADVPDAGRGGPLGDETSGEIAPKARQSATESAKARALTWSFVPPAGVEPATWWDERASSGGKSLICDFGYLSR